MSKLFQLIDWFLPNYEESELLSGRALVAAMLVSLAMKFQLFFTSFHNLPLMLAHVLVLVLLRKRVISRRIFPVFFACLMVFLVYLRHVQLQLQFPESNPFTLLTLMPSGMI
jgi:hypothetical protein